MKPGRENIRRAKNFGALVLILVVAWEILPIVFKIPTYILPRFSSVVDVFRAKLPFLLQQTLPTAYELILGYILSVIIGVTLGVVIGRFTLVRDTVYPLLIIVYSIPKVALAPLIIIWLGFGMTSILTMIVLIAFFPVLVNTMVGVMNVQPEAIELVRTMTKSRTKEFLRVRLPFSIPYIFAGMKTAMTLAAVGAIFAEFIVGQTGLGFVILSAQQNLDVAIIFACLTVLVSVTLGLFGLVIVLERAVMPWRKDFDVM
jgi:NitT/TauT family transport system permease protein